MGQVTSLYIRKVVGAVVPAADQAAVLADIGLAPDGADVGRMIDADAYYGMLERIAAQLPDATDMGLRVGASMRCDDYGAFGLAWKTAPTLRASLMRGQNYWRILTSVAEFEIRPEGQDAWFLVHRATAPRLGLSLSNEATVAATLTIAREVAPQPVIPVEARFKHPAAGSGGRHETWFGCPVTFDADRVGVRFPAMALDRPNRLGDQGLSRYLDGQLEAALAQLSDGEDDLLEMIRRTVERALSDGVPGIGQVAAAMGLSERSLQRRLAAQDLSFRAVVDSVRRDLTEGLLVNSDYALTEIAFLAGFSEQSALTRAFRRWHGVPPAAFREARRDPA